MHDRRTQLGLVAAPQFEIDTIDDCMAVEYGQFIRFQKKKLPLELVDPEPGQKKVFGSTPRVQLQGSPILPIHGNI